MANVGLLMARSSSPFVVTFISRPRALQLYPCGNQIIEVLDDLDRISLTDI